MSTGSGHATMYTQNHIGEVYHFNSLKPEFTIVMFIHYKPRIAVVDEDELMWFKH